GRLGGARSEGRALQTGLQATVFGPSHVQEDLVIRRRLSYAVFLLICLALAALGHPKAQTRAAPAAVAIRGGTILTVTKGTIQNGTIVLRDGKIAAVGADVPIPPGADVVDAGGK